MALTNSRNVGPKLLLIPAILIGICAAYAQSDPQQVNEILKEEILPPAVADFEIRRYLLDRVAPPPQAPSTAEAWTAEAARLRRHLLDDVVFHGWPDQWVKSPPRFEDAGVIEGGEGYKIRKLRYEIVPGFQSVALLYEPENLSGKVPAILNVNGHVGPPGKSVEYKQKRCINFAKHGIMALNLEWFAFGELAERGNEHWFGAHLDLVGANELGLFYLEMRRGLDYLYDHPQVDRNRIGVTGLSGGGWQTIVLSSLDERVRVSVPVAGFSSLRSRIEAKRYGDLGDIEQAATDFLAGSDFTHLVAMMAPRPTLLIHNAEDDCCFRALLVKPYTFDAIRPFFRLYGKDDVFDWHENRDPATHNYQLDNRLASYRFFSRQFGLAPIENEDGVAPEIKSYDELVVGLPKDNLTILGLARKLGGEITRPSIPSEASARAAWVATQRETLQRVVRYKPLDLERLWRVANTKEKDVETVSYLFQMKDGQKDGLPANGVWLRSIQQSSDSAPVTLVLSDKGKETASEVVSDRVNRGESVLALDLLFVGTSWKGVDPYEFAQIVDGVGERPLGIQAAELIRIGRWAREGAGVAKLRLEATGIRSQAAALVAASIEPGLFSEIVVRDGMRSFSYVLDAPVAFDQAPELFCLDLYKDFDIDRLVAMAAPVKVSVASYAEIPKQE